MDPASRLVEIFEKAAPTSRREFLKRTAIMGASVPVFGSLLAACGGEDEDDGGDEPGGDAAPTATRDRPGVPTTNTGAGGGATATAGEEEEEDEPTATAEAETEPTATEEAEEEPEATEEPAGGAGEPVQGGMLVGLGHHEVASLSPDDWGPSVHFFCGRPDPRPDAAARSVLHASAITL